MFAGFRALDCNLGTGTDRHCEDFFCMSSPFFNGFDASCSVSPPMHCGSPNCEAMTCYKVLAQMVLARPVGTLENLICLASKRA